MFQLPDAENPASVADWIELELASGEPQLSKTFLSSVIESLTGSEPGETLLADIWRNLEERQSRYSRNFFECEGDIVHRKWEGPAPIEYSACLLFSLYGVSDAHRSDPKLFERLVALAIKNYLRGKVFVFGWPALSGAEADIGARVKEVATATKERFVEAPAERYKDRGVDVIAWQPFEEHIAGEHRTNQIVILAQCAAGKNWRDKTTQLPLRAWTQYIHWACDPVQGFAVPRVIPLELWHDISRECEGILFDRIRILNLLSDGITDSDLKNALQEWVTGEFQEEAA